MNKFIASIMISLLCMSVKADIASTLNDFPATAILWDADKITTEIGASTNTVGALTAQVNATNALHMAFFAELWAGTNNWNSAYAHIADPMAHFTIFQTKADKETYEAYVASADAKIASNSNNLVSANGKIALNSNNLVTAFSYIANNSNRLNTANANIANVSNNVVSLTGDVTDGLALKLDITEWASGTNALWSAIGTKVDAPTSTNIALAVVGPYTNGATLGLTALQSESDTLATVASRGDFAGTETISPLNVNIGGSLSGLGRWAFGVGVNVTNIHATAYGASQSGNNGGTMSIDAYSFGASQSGNNGGTMIIGIDSYGASQSGNNFGTMVINAHSYGASQSGSVGLADTAENNAVGAIQLFDLTGGQVALTTTDGKASILLGAGVSSNKNAIVAGDGQVSHGDGSITAGGGFYGNGSGLTNLNEIDPHLAPALSALSNVVNTASVKATSSAGSTLNSLSGAECLRWGVGSSCAISTTDGFTVGGALSVTGIATFTTNAFSSVDYTVNAPADNELVTAGFVRSLAIGGVSWYFSQAITNGFGEKTANFVALQADVPINLFTNSIASPIASNTYIAGGVTTNTYTALRSPISMEVYIERVGGNSSSVIPVHMEVYYIYNGATNHLGDWEVQNQFVTTSTATTPLRFVVSFPEPTITGAVKVVSYLKTGTVKGSSAGVNIYGGDGRASFINIPSASSGGTTVNNYYSINATPISQLTTGAVVTVTPTQSKKVYSVATDIPITLTNDLTQLNANCTTNFEWETWINYTSTNALATVWDSRIEWQTGTPDLTVTGLYKFAMSTACGTNIMARQVYPTVYPWVNYPMPVTANAAEPEYGGKAFLSIMGSAGTNGYFVGVFPSASRSLIRSSIYVANNADKTNAVWSTRCIGFANAVESGVATTNAIVNSSALTYTSTHILSPPPTVYSPAFKFSWVRSTPTLSTVAACKLQTKTANEIESKHADAGGTF